MRIKREPKNEIKSIYYFKSNSVTVVRRNHLVREVKWLFFLNRQKLNRFDLLGINGSQTVAVHLFCKIIVYIIFSFIISCPMVMYGCSTMYTNISFRVEFVR